MQAVEENFLEFSMGCKTNCAADLEGEPNSQPSVRAQQPRCFRQRRAARLKSGFLKPGVFHNRGHIGSQLLSPETF